MHQKCQQCIGNERTKSIIKGSILQQKLIELSLANKIRPGRYSDEKDNIIVLYTLNTDSNKFGQQLIQNQFKNNNIEFNDVIFHTGIKDSIPVCHTGIWYSISQLNIEYCVEDDMPYTILLAGDLSNTLANNQSLYIGCTNNSSDYNKWTVEDGFDISIDNFQYFKIIPYIVTKPNFNGKSYETGLNED